MVVDRYNGVGVFLTEGTDEIIGAFLHLWVGTLDSVQLNTVAITAGIYGGYTTATQSDAVVVTTDDDNLITLLGLFLQTVTLGTVTDTSGKHDDFVIGVLGVVLLLVLEGEHRTADQWLSELITEVGGTIRCLDQYLLGSLVQPLTNRQDILPVTLVIFYARIRCHIDGCSGNRPGTYTTTHTVTDLTTCSCGGTIEGLYRGGEVVGLCLQRDDALDVLNTEIVARRLVGWGKLLYNRTLCEGDIIFIGRENLVGILLRGLLDHRKETRLHLLAVDDKGTTEYLMTAVLGVDLGKTEYLGVCQRTTVLFLNLMEVLYLLRREGESFLLVILFQIVHILDGLRLDIDGENLLIQPVVHTLQHGVVLSIL